MARNNTFKPLPDDCVAHFSKREGTDNLIGSPGRFAVVRCRRRATEKVGTVSPLALCAAHARMAREGFVDPNGNVENPNTVADCKRYGIAPPWSWAKGAK